MFIDNASLIASTVTPVTISLAYCQIKAPIVARGIKWISIFLSPIDTVIQIVVAPIWIIYDDIRSNSNFSEWFITPFRLPVKVLIGIIACVANQVYENYHRIKDISEYDANELYHQYKEKFTWLSRSNQQNPVNQQNIEIIARGNGIENDEIPQKIGPTIFPILHKQNYTHLYLYKQTHGAPPALFENIDGAFADRRMPNKGKSSFLLLCLHPHSLLTTSVQEQVLDKQPSAKDQVTIERTGVVYGPREYNDLIRYNLLPLRTIKTLQNLPAFSS